MLVAQKRRSREFYLFFIILLVYVFFNSFLLPVGLLYTMLLSPVMFIFLLNSGDKEFFKYLSGFLIISITFFLFHLFQKINISYYITSISIYLCCLLFYCFFRRLISIYWLRFEALVKQVAKINIVLVVIAFFALVTGIGSDIFWFRNEITQLIGFKRLRLLTYESSYYGTLLVPFFFFYFQYFYFKSLTRERTFLFATLIISILLSLSYGTIGGIGASVAIVMLINLLARKRKKYNNRIVITAIVVGCAIIILSIFVFYDSGVMARITNILEGKDTSVNGRAFDSYTIALNVLLKEDSMLFGIGPGQFKVLGANEVNRFYEYFLSDTFDASRTVRLPCANAETLVTYGVLGLAIRLFLEIYLFVKTDVFSSSYRLHLFVFMFLTQFAGSNLANLPEYFIWAICFTPESFYDNFFIGNTPATRKISRS